MKRFSAHYKIQVLDGEQIDKKLTGIAYEQSVELPPDVISDRIREAIVGRIEHVEELAAGQFKAEISYPVENTGGEINQFLNVLFGNISIKPGIQVVDVDWQPFTDLFGGPAFGIPGIREQLSIPKRALSCTALKPMGMSAKELGEFAYQFALGGIDIIKDDHGLANQSYAPFSERLEACVEGIARANRETGGNSVYYPNITASPTTTFERYKQAAETGAGGVLLSPHLCGLEIMHELARTTEPNLPIMGHPAFSGSYVVNPGQGFSHGFLYGSLWRALGADFAIYPNTGGRFSFTPEECGGINSMARTEESPFKPIFPTPGGGMQRKTIPHWLEKYGADTVFLIGGSLYQHPEGIVAAASEIAELLAS